MAERIKIIIYNLSVGRALLFAWAFSAMQAGAHPMPNSVALLKVQKNGIAASFQTPLSQLQFAFAPKIDSLTVNTPELQTALRDYFLRHVRARGENGQAWPVNVGEIFMTQTQNPIVGQYAEIVFEAWIEKPPAEDGRKFTLDCDLIVHEVQNHSILVSVVQDWETGINEEAPRQVGVIQLDVPSGKIFPLQVSLQKGNWTTGFLKMIELGMRHINEGVDHLLFLLVLLLPAPLLLAGRRWRKFGGVRYSILRLLKIVTAFTIGHSITLLIGALGWVRAPAQPVEILIAVSILVSALHAIRPFFPGREVYVAAGFGLIHGLAFASVLARLDLTPGQMALSILGFNLGIELMQLTVVALTVPWLVLLSQTTLYTGVRVGGALLAALAAAAWIAERISGAPNIVSGWVQGVWPYAGWAIFALSILAVAAFWRLRRLDLPKRLISAGRFW